MLISLYKIVWPIFLSKSRVKRIEVPYTLNRDSVRLYARAPTVHERPHMAQARAIVVYGMLLRLHFYKF